MPHPPDAPRICQDCKIPHVENCGGCWGFGVYVDKRMEDGNPLPVRAGDAHRFTFPYGDTKYCSVCGSTPEGLPKLRADYHEEV